MIRCEKDRKDFQMYQKMENHSMIWWMFMAVTMESAVFMGKNYLNNCQSIVNTTDLTLKQMFDISTRLVSEQDERSQDWKQLVGRIIHGNTCHWLVTKGLSIFNARRSTFFRVLCCALGRFRKPSIERCMGNKDWDGWNLLQNTEFEWNIFPGFNSLQLSEEVKRLLFRLEETPENFTGRFLFMSMFDDISCGTQDNTTECLANAKLVSLYARRFGKG